MALTVKNLLKFPVHNTGEFMVLIQVTGDTAYPNTGTTIGYPITPSTFSLFAFASTSDFGAFTGNTGPATPGAYYVISDVAAAAGSGGAYSEPDLTTGNLRMFAANGTEVSNAATAAANSSILMTFGH